MGADRADPLHWVQRRHRGGARLLLYVPRTGLTFYPTLVLRYP